jgi:hypothetical protein
MLACGEVSCCGIAPAASDEQNLRDVHPTQPLAGHAAPHGAAPRRDRRSGVNVCVVDVQVYHLHCSCRGRMRYPVPEWRTLSPVGRDNRTQRLTVRHSRLCAFARAPPSDRWGAIHASAHRKVVFTLVDWEYNYYCGGSIQPSRGIWEQLSWTRSIAASPTSRLSRGVRPCATSSSEARGAILRHASGCS